MTKKELYMQMLDWLRSRYRELMDNHSFREGNISIHARLFIDAQFTEIWQKIFALSRTGSEADVKFLRKLIEKAVDMERHGTSNTYIDEKKKLALDFISKNGGAFEHQIAKNIIDGGSRINYALTKTVLGFLEKEGKIRKEENKWTTI